MSVVARVLAWRILRASSPAPLRLARRIARREELEARESRLLHDLVDTALRRRGTLRALARHFSGGKAESGVLTHLELGFAQLCFLDRVPDDALVRESLSATRRTLDERHGRIVSSALRAAIEQRSRAHADDPRRDIALRPASFAQPVFHDPKLHPLLWAEDALSMPVPLMKRWIKRYGEERAFELARGALLVPDLSLRIVAADRAAVLEELATAKIRVRPGGHASIVLADRADAQRLRASDVFLRGRVTAMGETALRGAELVQPHAGERILELCASRGAATAVLAAAGARVTARESDERRIQRVRKTVERLNVAEHVELSVGRDAADLEAASFDAVLVGAPCSDTGVLAKRPGARWRFGTERQAALAQVQTTLLESAARCVRPGGRLVYATHSIEPEENERRVRTFLASHSDFSLSEEFGSLPATRSPAGPLDGGYAARLVRRA